MTFLEAKQDLSRRLDIDYSDIANNQLFTDTDLGSWIQFATIKAWDFKPWPFTNGAKTGTTIASDYFDYPPDMASESAYLLKVAGKEYKKLNYADYLKFLEDNPTATDKIWSEYKRFIFINKNAYTVGYSFDVYGKLHAPALVNATDLLPFSPDSDNQEYSGNEAICVLAYATALESEKKKNPQQARLEDAKGMTILQMLWKPFADGRSTLQPKNRPFMNVPDFFSPHSQSSANNLGNFNN